MVKDKLVLLLILSFSCCLTEETTTTTTTTQQYYCGPENPCVEGGCYLFPEMSYPICYEGDPCTRCPTGKCVQLESYPVQIRCLEDATTSTSTTTTTSTTLPEKQTECDQYCLEHGYELGGSCQLNSFECNRRKMKYVPPYREEPCPDTRLDTCCCKTNESIEL